MLSIQKLHASIGEAEILKGVSLEILPGEIHFLMGPNGSGKSTLAQTLLGSPSAKVTSGDIVFEDESIVSLLPEERARRGLYLGFQYPAEVSGVSVSTFLRSALSSRGEILPAISTFQENLTPLAASLGMPAAIFDRNLNEGFSGGEKKRSEIFQLAVLKPRLAILDEFDSGLDVDGIRAVSAALKNFMQPDRSLLIITHYGRIIEQIEPHRAHIMIDGRIAQSGNAELVCEVGQHGFRRFKSYGN